MTNIMTPSGKIITPDSLFVRRRFARNNFDLEPQQLRMSGEYKLIKRRADESVVEETPWFKNLILNSGLDMWATATSGTFRGRCVIGTGTAAAAVSQTALGAQTAQTTTINASNNTGVATSAPWYGESVVTWRFAIGALNGSFTEVGVGDTVAATLFSRALITPDGVNPAAISVLADEQLDVVYRLRVFPPSTDAAGSITLAGSNYNYVGRACEANTSLGTARQYFESSSQPFEFGLYVFSSNAQNFAYTGGIGAITGRPSGTPAASGLSHQTNSYTNGSYGRGGSINYGLNDGNLSGGIRSVQVYVARGGFFQYEFTPNIPKDATKTLRLDMNVSWARRP